MSSVPSPIERQAYELEIHRLRQENEELRQQNIKLQEQLTNQPKPKQ